MFYSTIYFYFAFKYLNMARVITVEKARKDYPESGIKKGDKYYWWKFRFGGKFMSLTYPKQSQLTQSDFLSTVYSIQESLSEIEVNKDSVEDDIQNVVDELEQLRDEQEEKRSNMPDALQDVGSGELLQNRYESLDEMINELQGIDLDIDDELSEEELVDRLEEIQNEISNVSYNGE